MGLRNIIVAILKIHLAQRSTQPHMSGGMAEIWKGLKKRFCFELSLEVMERLAK